MNLIERVKRAVGIEEALVKLIKRLTPHEQKQVAEFINHLLGDMK